MEQNKQTDDFGAMIGIIIVVILLLIGAFYFGNQRIKQSKQFQNSINETTTNEATATTSTSSDKISDIERDAKSIDVNSLGSGINNL